MRTAYSMSSNLDSYEAGLEIAEPLKAIEPEIVILFSSIHYDMKEFFRALFSILPPERTLLWGGTGDGVYSPMGVFNFGVSAIAINSEGRIAWHLEACDKASLGSGQKAGACADSMMANFKGRLRAGMAVSDFQNDGVEVCDELWRRVQCPIIGGLTGDDWSFKRGQVFKNDQALENAVSFLGLSGDFAFDCHSASGWKPIGQTGIIKEAQGNLIKYIDDKTAYEFMESEFGLPPAEAELGVIPLAAYSEEQHGHFFMRTVSHIDMKTGELTLFGSIPVGTTVQVCNATRDDVLEGVNLVLEAIRKPDFTPKAAVIVSCGGRKWILEKEIGQEVTRFQEVFGRDFPITGFASFGEIGPFKEGAGGWTRPYFHNVSYVVFLVGDRDES